MSLHRRALKFAFVGFAAATILPAVWFAEYVHWAITGPKGIAAVPTSPLVVGDLPPEYIDCSVGSITIKIPPFLTRTTSVKGRAVLFEGSGARMLIFLPEAVPQAETARWKETMKRLPPRFRCSRQRAVAAIYSTSSDDFRWTMSRSELIWHKWKIREGGIARVSLPIESVETLFHRDVEATLLWMKNRNYAALNWEAANGSASGMISFSQEGALSRDWVRHVCASMTFSDKPYSLPMTDTEITALIHQDKRQGKIESRTDL